MIASILVTVVLTNYKLNKKGEVYICKILRILKIILLMNLLS